MSETGATLEPRYDHSLADGLRGIGRRIMAIDESGVTRELFDQV